MKKIIFFIAFLALAGVASAQTVAHTHFEFESKGKDSADISSLTQTNFEVTDLTIVIKHKKGGQSYTWTAKSSEVGKYDITYILSPVHRISFMFDRFEDGRVDKKKIAQVKEIYDYEDFPRIVNYFVGH